jgi:predicted DNA-binding transcriptional regulator YafY
MNVALPPIRKAGVLLMLGLHGRASKMGARLFELADLIARHPGEYTAKRLAEHFGVSVRTICRDIHLLEDLDIRVETRPSGGYFIMRDLSRLPVPLTEPERIAFEMLPWLLKSALADRGIVALVDAYLNAVEKIAHRAGISLTSQTRASQTASIVVDLNHLTEPSHHSPSDELLKTENEAVMEIIHAINHALTIEIEYHGMTGDEVTKRRIDPYCLVPWQNSLYVVGWCHLRSDYRTFKVARMKSLRVTTFRYQRNAEFSLVDFLQEAWGIDQSGEPIDATLAFDASVTRYAQEEIRNRRILEESIDDAGRYIVRIRAHSNPEFLRFIMQYGSKVEVLGPDTLRDAVEAEVSRLAVQYRVTENSFR